MKPVLSAHDLSFTYPNGKEALKSISLCVGKGQFCALLGPNGAGKSTFFCLVSALMKPSAGNLSICDFNMDDKPRLALSKMGFVFQQTTLDLDLSVVQNLHYFASLHGLSRKDANRRIEAELERLSLRDRAKEKVRFLNGGHRRRVEIARALLHEPDVLLLDEPTVGLDVKTRKDLVDHVHDLAENSGVAVLWATHLIDEIRDTDQVVILHQGEIVADGQARDLADASLEESFNRLTQARA